MKEYFEIAFYSTIKMKSHKSMFSDLAQSKILRMHFITLSLPMSLEKEAERYISRCSSTLLFGVKANQL